LELVHPAGVVVDALLAGFGVGDDLDGKDRGLSHAGSPVPLLLGSLVQDVDPRGDLFRWRPHEVPQRLVRRQRDVDQ